ncbi:NYN domain-containing protein [Candidatus Nomurabacteria bacterium]|nr:NYN domain-containing protein [Candidatus Nomurabacteria bacterium]
MKENNLAFIDGQNLYLGTRQDNWSVDLAKLRIYLKEKYHIVEAYYFLGYLQEENDDLYKEIQKAGFIVLFKEHNQYALTKKKGNVDTDIVFEIMKNLVDNNEFDKVVLVSGDGDYKKLVEYLITKNKFNKILFPNKKFASSLYKKLGSEFYDYLENLKAHIKKIK